MNDYVTSLIRTVIPAVWGSVLAWLVGVNLLPAELLDQAQGFAVVLTAVGVAAFYALARWLESRPWFPRWLARVLMGSGQAPTYAGRHALQ